MHDFSDVSGWPVACVEFPAVVPQFARFVPKIDQFPSLVSIGAPWVEFCVFCVNEPKEVRYDERYCSVSAPCWAVTAKGVALFCCARLETAVPEIQSILLEEETVVTVVEF